MVYFDSDGQRGNVQKVAQPAPLSALKRPDTETWDRSEQIRTTLSNFFAPPSEESKRYREGSLSSTSNLLFSIVTPEAIQILVDSTPESREFNARLKVAAQKSHETPLMAPNGTLIKEWTHGYIALAIDSRGSVLGFSDLPEGRAKFLNYQLLKALRARVLSEQAKEGETHPSREGNIELLERLGINRGAQYIGAQDDAQLRVGSEMRWVYIVGGATKPDRSYIEEVYGPNPRGFSQLEGVGPLECEADDLFGKLVLHYMLHPNAEVRPIPEPEPITTARRLLRKQGDQ